MGNLTAAAVRAAKNESPKGARPIRMGDGDGLYLQVAPGSTKSWLLRYTLRGKAREMGLGPVGEPPGGVPLAKARVLAGGARALLRDGRDPLVERETARLALRRAQAEASERTFRAAACALLSTADYLVRLMLHTSWPLVLGLCVGGAVSPTAISW